MSEAICIIGSGKELVDRAKANGLKVLLIQSHIQCGIEPQKLADMVFICDFDSDDSLEQVVKLCNSSGISKALTLSENATYFTAQVNDKLSKTDTYYEWYRFFCDKLHMRRELEATPLNRVAFMAINDKGDLIEAANKLGMPMILKPVYGVGSRNVHLISSIDEVIDVSELNEQYIAESFIVGSEYSLECFSKCGKHVLHAVTEKRLFKESPSMFVESSHLIKRVNNTGELYNELQLFVEQLLNHVGYKNGPSHIEVKVDDNNRISLIEAHSRVGGDSIPELVALATGVDLYNLSILSHMGYEFDNSRKQVKRESAIAFFPSSPVGEALIGIQKLYCNPCVTYIKEPNNTLEKPVFVRKSSDRNGYVLYCTQDDIEQIDLIGYLQEA